MKSPFGNAGALLSVALGVQIRVDPAQAGCSSGEPVFPSFAYPQWANGGDKPRAKDRAACTKNSTFYLRFDGTSLDDTSYDTSTADFALDGGGTQPYTCALALQNRAIIDTSENVPADDASCCNSFRYRSDIDISAQIDGEDLTLNIDAVYGENATAFMELCEELWACSSYVESYASIQCENNKQRGLSCPQEKTESLCFNEAYDAWREQPDIVIPPAAVGDPGNPLSSDYAEAEMGTSSAWILNVCFGAAEPAFNFSNPTEGYSISELQDMRDGMCETAEDLSDRMNFAPANSTDCNDILQCFVDIATSSAAQGEGAQSLSVDDFVDSKPDLCSGDAAELLQKKEDICSASTLSTMASYPIINGNGTGCRAQPFCPESLEPFFTSFSPGYPSGSPYEELVPAPGNGFDNRTSTQLVDTYTNIKTALGIARIPLKVLSDGLPASWPYFFKVLPVVAIDSAKLVVETMLEMWSMHDGIVNSAEIEALYENSRQMLDGSAAIYDEVVCRCAESYTLRGQGCDGKDNNCDQSIDDCEEDQFAPIINVDEAINQCGPNRWFTVLQEAIDCVTNAAVVGDDCDQSVLEATPTVSGTCSWAEIALDASDACGNAAQTKVVPVLIDPEPPTVSCSVGQGGSTGMRLMDTSGAGDMVNINLQYDAVDSCGAEMDVTVTVFANEEEDFQKQGMGVFYTSGTEDDKAGLYVASKSCWSAGMGTCIRDPNQDPNTFYRLYTVQVSAFDASGREATPAECTVLVLPEERLHEDVDISKSTQRFAIADFSSIFDESSVQKYQLGGTVSADDLRSGVTAPTPPADLEMPIDGAGAGKWYVDWMSYKCVKGCVGGAHCGGPPGYSDELYDTPAQCCGEMPWVLLEDCVQNNALSNHYYVDWTRMQCVMNCEGGPPCGGAAEAWNELHEHLPDCCKMLEWVADGECLYSE